VLFELVFVVVRANSPIFLIISWGRELYLLQLRVHIYIFVYIIYSRIQIYFIYDFVFNYYISINPILLEKVNTVNLDFVFNYDLYHQNNLFWIHTIYLHKTSIELSMIAFLRIMMKCVSCDSRKRTLSECERHTWSRAKKWKYSVKVKSTMLPLEKWVCISSFYIRVMTNLYVGFKLMVMKYIVIYEGQGYYYAFFITRCF